MKSCDKRRHAQFAVKQQEEQEEHQQYDKEDERMLTQEMVNSINRELAK